MRFNRRLGPFDPIFSPDKVTGGVVVGNTPGVVPTPDPLYDTILSLGPLSYFTLRDPVNATPAPDLGSVDIDSTFDTSTDVAGFDGHDYIYSGSPTGSAMTAGSGNDTGSTQLSIATHSGLTVVYLVRPDAPGAGWPCASKRNSGDSPEWVVTDNSASIYNDSGGHYRRLVLTATPATATWRLMIVRFPSGGAYPTIRVNGVDEAGSQSGSGTVGAASIARLNIHGGHNSRYPGALGHLAVFAGQLVDDDCALIETAASFEGWF